MYRPYRPSKPTIVKPSQKQLQEMFGSNARGPVWVAGMIGNVQDPSSQPAVTPSPTPTISVTPTITPTSSVTPTPTISVTPSLTPTTSVTPTSTPVTPTPTNTPTISVTPTNTPTPSSSPVPSGTTQANTYLAAVTTNGGTGITDTISAATRTLFTSLVSNGLYDNMIAMYPLIGGVSNSSKLNAVNVGTYDITWAGGMVFTTTGATGNGTNAYGDTGFIFSANTAVFDNGTMGVYTNSTPSSSRCAMGAGALSTSDARAMIFDFALDWGCAPNPNGFGRVAPAGYSPLRAGQYIGVSSGTSINKMLIGRSSGTTIFNSSTSPTKVDYPGNLFLFRRGDPASPNYFNGTITFSFVYNGALTNTQMTTLATIINTYQTSLGRNVY